MSSTQAPELGLRPATAPSERRGTRSEAASRAPAVLAAALLLVCLYAAFDHGAVGAAGDERVQLWLAVVATVAAAASLWNGTLRLRAPAIVWTAVGLLAAFAVWSAVSLAWSVAPDQTWAECNRAITYALALVLAVAVGASHARAVTLVARGFLAVCLAVTAYALAQKLLPGLRIGGVFDLNQTTALARLQEPLGYWNALALFVAMGVPIALAIAADRNRYPWLRLSAAVAVVLMLETIAFTYSRGGVLALICSLAVATALSGARLRFLMWLALVGLAAAPPVAIGLLSHNLTVDGVALSTRELAGLELIAVLAACLLLMVLAGRRMIAVERRTRLSQGGAHRIGRSLAWFAVALVVIALLAVALSPRGLGGTVSHAWKSFTTTRATSVSNPSRLLSADSENRWVWWKEAAGAFSDRPLAGWGAGSFGVVHLLYRRDTLSVQQPHSVPLQFLAETGIVGALLALGGFALLLVAGVAAVRRGRTGSGRLLGAALLAGGVAYAVHACYDWDWDIPALTLPALVFLGTLGGSLGRAGPAPAPTKDNPNQIATARAIAVAVGAFCLCAFAASVVLPRLAARQASQALVSAASGDLGRLRPALATALEASKLDPLSDAGLRAASTIAVHLRRPAAARRYVLEAVRRDPTDVEAWQQLAFEDLASGAQQEGLAAAQRARALDPHGGGALTLAQGTTLTLAPPAQSATAAATP
jgi:hypothetical protein